MGDMRFPRNMFIQDYAKEYDFPYLFGPITKLKSVFEGVSVI